jgi:PhnB protein
MAKQSLSGQLDQSIAALLAQRNSSIPAADRKLRPLLRIAAGLRGLPNEKFRTSLKSDLQRRTTMASQSAASPRGPNYMREGFHTVTPYLLVARISEFMDFLKQAFGATELLRVKDPKSGLVMHAEMKIGDSVLEMAQANEQFPPRLGVLHIFVPDVDAVYRQALKAGATSLYAPMDQPYGSRDSAVQDGFGHNWYIATRNDAGPAQYIPEGLHTVTPFLTFQGVGKLIEFLKAAFGAVELQRHEEPNGRIAYATVRIGDSIIEMNEARDQWTPMPMSLHLYVPDTDALYERAIAAGATSVRPPADQPYGDRAAGVADAFGNQWFIATHLRDLHF